MTKVLLSELHTTHINWMKNLRFSEDEIKTFKSRLEELVMKNTKVEITSQIEHFQNQFILQNEVIDILKHDINAEEERIADNAKANNVATDHRWLEANAVLFDRMKMFDKLYAELKSSFTRFLSETM